MANINFKTYMLITGATGGIGSALCKLLSNKGIIPIVGYNKSSVRANNLAKQLNSFSVKIDLGNEKSIQEGIKFIIGQLEEKDVLKGIVLVASPPPDLISFTNTGSKHLQNQFQINLIGPQALLKGLIKKFYQKKNPGTIIGVLTNAIGSDSQLPVAGMSSYIIAKSALKTMLQTCKSEFPWLKIKTVTPGFTKTKMLDVFDSRFIEILNSQKKISSPEYVAKTIVKEIIS